MSGTVSNVLAGCFALAAFAVAIVAGIASENSASHVLSRAVIAMMLCYPLGLIAGLICERVIAEHLRDHAQQNPIPVSPDEPAERTETATAGAKEKEVTVA